MAAATQMLKIVIQVVDKATAAMTQVQSATTSIDKSVGNLNRKFGTFDARLLSLLFGGMALQRMFGGMLRGIVNTFLRAEDETSGLSHATTRLSASWEFLKFSIMDALNTDFFIGMIDGVVRFLNWLSQLDAGWKVTFLTISGGLFIIGGGLMLIGQFKLFWDAVFGIGGFLNTIGIIESKTLGASGVFTKLKNWAIAGLVIKTAFDIENYLEGEIGLRKLIDTLGTDIGLIGLISGQPWLILVGIMFKLIPFGEQISKFGKSMVERGAERVEAGLSKLTQKGELSPFERLSGIFGLATGGLESFGGSAVTGVGTIAEFLDVYIQNIEESSAKTDEYTASLESLQTPLSDTITKIDGKDNSLNNSLKKTGTEMDVVSGEKTDGFINASNERIDQIDKEVNKIGEWQQKLKDWESSRQSFISSLRNSSSVSD